MYVKEYLHWVFKIVDLKNETMCDEMIKIIKSNTNQYFLKFNGP